MRDINIRNIIRPALLIGGLIIGLAFVYLVTSDRKVIPEGFEAPYPPPGEEVSAIAEEALVMNTKTAEAYPPSEIQESESMEAYPPPKGRESEPMEVYPPPAPQEDVGNPEPVGEPPSTDTPLPTPLPTPVVTPIPAADPPFISPPQKPEEGGYSTVIHGGNLLYTLDSRGLNAHELVDEHTRRPLFPGYRSAGVRPWAWASPSPDGTRLAVVLTNAESRESLPKGESLEYGIYLFNLSNGGLELLVEAGVEPVWSPDGNQIAYRGTKNMGLWVVEVATGETREVFSVEDTELDDWVNFMTWSPDGNRIAFVKTFSMLEHGEIWIVDAAGDGQPVNLLPSEMYAFHIQWTPVGDQILYISESGEHLTTGRPLNLWIVDVETGDRQQVTQNITIVGGVPAWSPDGRWIVFGGKNKLEGGGCDLWLFDSASNEIKRLTHDSVSDLSPFWVGGTRIVYKIKDKGLWEMNLIDGALKHIYQEEVDYFTVVKIPP
jgi:hypothetical protein